jgi:serine/threonine-protein kinase
MLSPEKWSQVKALFDEALELDQSQRSLFPDPASTDPDIWHAVRELIDAYDGAAARASAEDAPPTPTVFLPGQLVAGRFRIVQIRGRGGMGEVYQAFDERLKINVGLKTIRADWAPNNDALRRFEREIRVARAVSHPNLCRVFDLVEHRESSPSAPCPPIVCLTMEWLEGQTLQEYLQHTRPIPLPEALAIARQIASALDALHASGIVHRDLKPGNVILVNEPNGLTRAVVTDFGLAKSAETDDLYQSTLDAHAGAPYFMAPEQLRNDKPTPASDLYSFALVVDEMVTVSRAFNATSVGAIYYQKLRELPIPPTARNAALPSHWDAAILRSLDHLPANRFPSAAQFVLALESPKQTRKSIPLRPIAVAAALRLATLLALSLATPKTQTPLVVFRVHDLTADPAFAYLSSGLTSELVNSLVKVDGLTVKPFHGHSSDPAAAKLPDPLLLDADLQKHANRIRLSVRLSDHAHGDTVLWADSYDRDLQNPLALQTEVVQSIVQGVRSHLNENPPSAGPVQRAGLRLAGGLRGLFQSQAPAVLPTQSPAAFHAYLRALHLLEERRPESVRAAVQSLQMALTEDPAFGLAHAALADAYRTQLDMKQGSQEQLRALALASAQRAVGFSPYLAETHTSLAATRQLSWDWEGSERSYREAIRLAPKSPIAYRRLGGLILQFGRLDEALALYRKSIELDPYDYPSHSAYGMALQAARRPKEAEAHLKWTLAQRDFMSAHVNLGPVYATQGQLAQSPEEAERYFNLALAEAAAVARFETAGAPAGANSPTPSSDYMFAMFHAMRGDAAASRTYLDRMLARPDTARNSPVSLALVYAVLHESQLAVQYLRQAASVKDRGLLYLKVLPLWDPIRKEQGFQEIIRDMRL